MAAAYLWVTGGLIGLIVAFFMMVTLLAVVLLDVRYSAQAAPDADLDDLFS